jgi:3-oxoadipate enol-lactonase
MPFADLADARIHYRFDGPDAAPVLVLSNSLGCDLSMWTPQMLDLTARYRVLRYDTRGHGQSSVTAGPYSIELLGRDVVGLMRITGVQRAHFCGLSMGGMTGMWLGLHAAERIDHLVLCNTAAQIGTPGLWNARIDAVRAGGMRAIVDAVIGRWFTDDFIARRDEYVAPVRVLLERMSPEGYIACCEAVRDADFRDALPRIRLATLVIAGTYDLPTPPADGRFAANSIPGSHYVELPAPHLSNIETAAAFTDALLRFLE